MAGIGCKLRRLSLEETLGGMLVGYGSAALVCAGPWLLTILALTEVHLLQMLSGSGRGHELPSMFFHSVVTYCFAFSLLLTGGLQNLVTRYLADRLHQGSDAYHLPAFVGTLAVVNPLALLLGAVLFSFLNITFFAKLVSISLFVVLCDTWMAMIFLGVVRAYWSIVQAYALGCVLTALVGLLTVRWTAIGALVAFTVGQTGVFLAMVRILTREFRLGQPGWDFEFLSYGRLYPYLFLTGTNFYLAVWSGVLFYWVTPESDNAMGLRSYALHDISYFWGLLTTIPAMTLFFVRIETEFYEAYRAFYRGILEARARYVDLVQRRSEMWVVLTQGAADLLRQQGVFTLILLFCIPYIVSNLALSGVWIAALRVGLVGALALCFCQFALMILYYYELYREAFITTLLLLVGNLTTDLVTLSWGSEFHGLGLTVGSCLGLTYSVKMLSVRIRSLEYYTFMFQPMPGTIVCQDPQEAFGKTVRSNGQWLVPVE